MSKQTPLYSQHIKLGAKMVPFGGWDMPVSYKGIIEEHNATRKAAGLFDIGHMGLIKIEGKDDLTFIQSVATNDASLLALNECQYSILCTPSGGAIDDILVYRLPMFYMIICNASNFDKVMAWLTEKAKDYSSLIVAPYENYCAIALQGPKAISLTEKTLKVPLSSLKRNHTLWWRDIIISRTGYTGEDGVEMVIAKNEVAKIWEMFIAAGAQPCGLGARDTLRLEAGLPLYGHEYNDQTSPLEVGYSWAVKLNKGEFVGREALLKQKEQGLTKKLVGLEVEGRAIARQGGEVYGQEKVENGKLKIGTVSSGTFSPTLQKPIALAFLDPTHAKIGNLVQVKIRENFANAKIVAKSFYKR
ncbi:MAG: glycine cleavage system aminomethyltransferase GcvT [Candidatus Margulisiibacteriota bacterium]